MRYENILGISGSMVEDPSVPGGREVHSGTSFHERK